MGTVRTVLGDVAADRLGRVNYHEHFFQVSPLLPGDELDDEDASTAEAADVRAHGTDTVVDATPLGLGRSPAALARLSAASGLAVVATTGLHRPEHYGDGHWVHGLTEEQLADRLTRDLVQGCAVADDATSARGGGEHTGVRAGVLKVAAGYWSLPPLTRRAVTAVGAAHAATGAPVVVHLEHCSAGHEVLDLLAAEGVPADAVALAHVDRVPDPGLHASLAGRGAYLGHDGAARYAAVPESELVACLAAVVDLGHGDRLLLGGDVARASRYRGYGGFPGMRYLTERYLPRVRSAIGDEATEAVLVENPARWLSWSPPGATVPAS
ncbi:phosphotriesterase family protein [Auraticoccus monumenti]|uniref:Phosphotriesterase-related protein n=1 Tax=Auraticoccus monumenti TaxID=675864 RepID=A0A1G7AN45_9ACTN|nr:aryldialkylphosphatase [Auraticoccus monumenti]SDE15435.1 phosphotriesterase-related protein [Auraticoccus monumenti]